MLVLVYFACEIGHQLTYTVNKINEQFLCLHWYLFPAKIQQILPFAMVNVEKPVIIPCFGIMYASRDQFKKVQTNLMIREEIFRLEPKSQNYVLNRILGVIS